VERQDIKEYPQKHLDDDASAPLDLKFISSLMIEPVHHNMEE